jgi:hypothetical protein
LNPENPKSPEEFTKKVFNFLTEGKTSIREVMESFDAESTVGVNSRFTDLYYRIYVKALKVAAIIKGVVTQEVADSVFEMATTECASAITMNYLRNCIINAEEEVKLHTQTRSKEEIEKLKELEIQMKANPNPIWN